MASKLAELVYWRNMWWTGTVFTGLVIGLASLFQLSTITVLCNVFLGVMCLTFPLRLYYKLLEMLKWNRGIHPFQSYLDYDSTLTDKDTVMLVEELVLLSAFAVTSLKRLLFIGSILDSVKFLLLLYLLSYIGVLINGLTLIIIAVIAIFSLPLLYKKQQVRIRKIVRATRAFWKRIQNIFLSLYKSARPPSAPAPASKPATTATAAAALKQKAKTK